MNKAGIIFLILSWGAIISLLTFCFYNIFKKKRID